MTERNRQHHTHKNRFVLSQDALGVALVSPGPRLGWARSLNLAMARACPEGRTFRTVCRSGRGDRRRKGSPRFRPAVVGQFPLVLSVPSDCVQELPVVQLGPRWWPEVRRMVRLWLRRSLFQSRLLSLVFLLPVLLSFPRWAGSFLLLGSRGICFRRWWSWSWLLPFLVGCFRLAFSSAVWSRVPWLATFDGRRLSGPRRTGNGFGVS